ncbi:sialate O-acetylesterase [Persicobacter psychrovividus]
MKPIYFLLTSLLLLVSCTSKTVSPLSLPEIIQAGVVFQQQEPIRIWGWGSAGEKVHLKASWMQEEQISHIAADGRWEIILPAQPVRRNEWLKVFSRTDTLLVDPVNFGELWWIAGQSNAEFSLDKADSYPELQTEGMNPDVHLFQVHKVMSPHVQDRAMGQWWNGDVQQAANFSAIGYYFADSLQNALNCPVGIIQTAWGGTPIKAWLPTEQEHLLASTTAWPLRESRYLDTKIQALQDSIMKIRNAQMLLDQPMAAFAIPEKTEGTIRLPADWAETTVGETEGIVWLEKVVEVPQDFWGTEVTISLGQIDEMDMTFLNGNGVGSHRKIGDWKVHRKYKVAPDFTNGHSATVAVRLINTMGAGGLLGPAEEMFLSNGRDSVPLSGKWNYKKETVFPPQPNFYHTQQSGVMYNGMVVPIMPMPVKGMIWYQGEQDVSEPKAYGQSLQKLIGHYRKLQKKPDLPFLVVEIAPFDYGRQINAAEFRSEQLRVCELLSGVTLIGTADAGAANDIHPKDKKTIGFRASQLALGEVYQQPEAVKNRMLDTFKFQGHKISVALKNSGDLKMIPFSGLQPFKVWTASGGAYTPKVTVEGGKILLEGRRGDHLIGASYGWENYYVPTVFSTKGIPVLPFKIRAAAD